jgi:hypothetical protein
MHHDRSDHELIGDVLVRYATGIDTKDWPLFRTCFTDDVNADYGDIGVWNGVDEIAEYMAAAHAADAQNEPHDVQLLDRGRRRPRLSDVVCTRGPRDRRGPAHVDRRRRAVCRQTRAIRRRLAHPRKELFDEPSGRVGPCVAQAERLTR